MGVVAGGWSWKKNAHLILNLVIPSSVELSLWAGQQARTVIDKLFLLPKQFQPSPAQLIQIMPSSLPRKIVNEMILLIYRNYYSGGQTQGWIKICNAIEMRIQNYNIINNHNETK